MDLYTMNENFIPKDVVDEFQSAIWTERYSSAGEVQLVVPASTYYLEMLKEGTFLGLNGTDEVMELKTDSIENGLLTVVGKTLLKTLDERIHWAKTTDAAQPIGDYTLESARISTVLADRVEKMVITPVTFVGTPWADLNLDWERDKIQFLELGDIDPTGELQRVTVPVGPLYSALQPLAEKDGLGLSLYLESADAEVGYVLKFTTYRGVDRSSTPPDGAPEVPLIRLTPDLENLGQLKEIRSIDGYKNVVYVVYENKISIHYEDPSNIPEGFARRVMVRDAIGEPIGTTQIPDYLGNRLPSYGGGSGYYGGAYSRTVVSPADIVKFREQNAKDALANNNYIRAVDGQVSQSNPYKFGQDYGMGDILELEGLTGILQKARVTEYIRAQDATGEREYPTLSVITEPTPFPI